MQPLLNFLSIEFTVLLTAALPIIELRGAIPVGISLGLSPIHATLISLVGSMIPVPFILFSIRPIFNYLKTTKMFKKLVHSITDRSMNGSGKIQKYGAWGLLVFVAIPLPGTGAWTGTLAASILDMDFKKSTMAVMGGVILAGIIMGILSLGVFKGILG